MILRTPSKKRWLANKILPLALQGTVIDNPPFTHGGRRAALASIVDAWSVVVVLPLFTSVVLFENVTPPPPRNDKPQAVVHHHWIPPDWAAQTTIKATTSGPAGSFPGARFTSDFDSISVSWPQPDWPPQRAPSTPQSAVSDAPLPHVAHLTEILRWSETTTSPLWQNIGGLSADPVASATTPYQTALTTLVGMWPQPDWPTAVPRKTPIPSAPPVPPNPASDVTLQTVILPWVLPEWSVPRARTTPLPSAAAPLTPVLMPRRAAVEIDRWSYTVPIPLWQTLQGVSSDPTASQPTPYINDTNLLVGMWPQPAWDTQRVRTTPIPDVPAVPYSNAIDQAILQWTSLDWPAQWTRKTPIPSQAAQVDNPPPRTLSYHVFSRWFDRPVQALSQNLGYFSGPTVAPSDAPPPHVLPWAVYATAWTPDPYVPVWATRLIDLTVQTRLERDWLDTVLGAWIQTEFYQPKRPVVTPSGVLVVNNPPFTSRRPQLAAYDANWPSPAWPAQHAPLLVQPGVDRPPVTDLMRRRSLDIITRTWETTLEPPPRRRITVPSQVVFRRTLSQFGTGVGHRQLHGWS